ncbi:STAS domain-containing protein [Granulicella sp. S190]|uniref:STAS domain-containing protein n=1 Tax=Granulicella sp. S190 TaxID=1747226 RepID=UPI00131C0A6A|nr:STAS domain-containing protein [Granulicella sp. S190]
MSLDVILPQAGVLIFLQETSQNTGLLLQVTRRWQSMPKESTLSDFAMNVLKYGEVEAITLNGPLLLGASVNALRAKMENLAAHGGRQFVLNLTGVTRMDSSGVGLLVMILSSTKEAGGSLKLVNPSKQVTQVLKMCNLLPLFEVFDEEQAAISSFAPQ